MKRALPVSPMPRILVVDDEPHVRRFLKLTLQAEGFNVLEAADADHAITLVHTASPDAMILDAGPAAIAAIAAAFAGARTLVWNGPLGAFEIPPFNAATDAAARQAASLTRAGKLLSVAGGGDTVAALNASGSAEAFSYVSTAGGAFLEWLEGKTLPGVAALEDA